MAQKKNKSFEELLAERAAQREAQTTQQQAKIQRKEKTSNAFLDLEIEQREIVLEAWEQCLNLIEEGEPKADVLWAFLKAYDTPKTKTLSLEGKERFIDFIEFDLVKWLRSGQAVPIDLHIAYSTSIQLHYGEKSAEKNQSLDLLQREEKALKRKEQNVQQQRQTVEQYRNRLEREQTAIETLELNIRNRFPIYSRLSGEYRTATQQLEAKKEALEQGIKLEYEHADNKLTELETDYMLEVEQFRAKKQTLQPEKQPEKDDEKQFWLQPLGLEFQGLDMVLVEAGKYWRGDFGANNSRPQAKVYLDRYEISPAIVTQALYLAVNDLFITREPGLLKPLTKISWFEAIDFCNQLSEIYGYQSAYQLYDDGRVHWRRKCNGFRLATEAEWEAAARANQSTMFSGGDQPQNYAWTAQNSHNNIKKVRRKRPNAWGLYDMSGLVWEWVWDWYDEDYYQNSPKENPQGPQNGRKRVIRGGSVSSDIDRAGVSFRSSAPPKGKDSFLGFRIARNR